MEALFVPSNNASKSANLIGQRNGDAIIFHTPKIGWTSWVVDEGSHVTWSGTAWQETSGEAHISNLDEIERLGLNTTTNLANRFAVKSDGSLFDFETDSHRLKLNKSDEVETASIVFQADYQGHAELGLTGDNNFHIRTSANGVNFVDRLNIDSENGSVSMPYQPVIFGQLGLPKTIPERKVF